MFQGCCWVEYILADHIRDPAQSHAQTAYSSTVSAQQPHADWISKSYGGVLAYDDLSPNIGLWWYVVQQPGPTVHATIRQNQAMCPRFTHVHAASRVVQLTGFQNAGTLLARCFRNSGTSSSLSYTLRYWCSQYQLQCGFGADLCLRSCFMPC